MINNKDMIGPNLIKLESVGSLVDVDIMEVYPCMEDDTPDWECGTPLTEVSDEWAFSLSEEDKKLLIKWNLLEIF
jgi:hypothetical protein